jgi:hypothetical protein
MLPSRFLLRAALRLQCAWQQVAPLSACERSRLDEQTRCSLAAYQAAWAQLTKARQHNLLLAKARLEPALLIRAASLCEALNKVSATLGTAPVVPPLRELLGELRQIATDFGRFSIDWRSGALGTVTAPIILRGVGLGPFEIRFVWQRLIQASDVSCFSITALEPNPAASNEAVTHPHVKERHLCAGQATALIESALSQGRLADAFGLIRGVLSCYNRLSAHVPLEEWSAAASCYDCGQSASAGPLDACEACQNDFCGDCFDLCSVCSGAVCKGCATHCGVCGLACCHDCLAPTGVALRNCCPNCRLRCPFCDALFAMDERQWGSGLCPLVGSPNRNLLIGLHQVMLPSTKGKCVALKLPRRDDARPLTSPIYGNARAGML